MCIYSQTWILAKSLTIQSMCIYLNVKDCFFPFFRKISRKASSHKVYTSIFLNYNADVSISRYCDVSCNSRFELSGGNYPKLISFGDSYLVGICVVPIFHELFFNPITPDFQLNFKHTNLQLLPTVCLSTYDTFFEFSGP